MPRQPTELQGAALERQAILAKVRRMGKEGGRWFSVCDAFNDLALWIQARTKRFAAKKGGLQRRRK